MKTATSDDNPIVDGRTALPRIVIFSVGVAALVMTLPGQTNGVSAFIDPLIDSLAIDRNGISLTYLFGTITSAFLLTWAGKVYDRLGSRRTGTIAAAGLGLSLFALSLTPHFVTVLERLGFADHVATFLLLALGFFLIRFFGQGVLSLVGKTMIFKWYDDKRGAANAVLSVVIPLTFALAPLIFDALIGSFGWQGAWMVLGLVLLPGFTIVASRTFGDPGNRHTESMSNAPRAVFPERLAFLSRIAARFGIRRTREPMRPESDKSLGQVLRSFPFWIFNITTTLSSLLVTGFTFHVVGIFAEAGISRAAALAIFLPAAVISIGIQTLGSLLSDYVRLKYFVVVHALAIALLLFFLPFLDRGPVFYVAVILAKGVAMAMFGINSSIVWPRFYGLRHLGSINGFATAWMVAGSALGPYVYSLTADLTGRFASIGIGFIPVCLFLSVSGFFADNPNRQHLR